MLFDDAIEPTALGYGSTERMDARKDEALLRERTQTGDAVLRARVVTLTSAPEALGSGWQIGFRTLESLAGPGAGTGPWQPGGEFSFYVPARGAVASGLVHRGEDHLVGTTFVVFVRQFERPSDDAETPPLHFHFAKDDKDELVAVQQAALLGELRGVH